MVIRIAIIIVIVYGSPVIALLFSCIISICRFLGVSSLSTLHGDTCNEVPGLVWRQIEVCRNNPQTLYCISEGARKGIMECKAQFRYERWNCTTQRNLSVFGQTLTKGSKETAFIYAILSAGVVHAVTQSCSAGNLTDCSCDMNRYGEKDGEGWEWGGCSDNIHYGTWFCKMFVDAPDANSKRDTRNLMNIHNNEVGRRVVEKEMKMQCRCHGVSGSCAVKTCWRSLPMFHKIGAHLKKLYETAVIVVSRSRKKLRRRDKTKRHLPIPKDKLVHMHRSRNYCRTDPSRGITGTRGRLCNKTLDGPGSCSLLCCGRGYNTQVVRYVNRCHCKFHWCCFVTCKSCESMVDVHTCK
eukprot:XP_014774239.1 PREDICTED: protein Wnt-16-like [Octopus bimaculoides]